MVTLHFICGTLKYWFFCCRIVRNKAAEKAKHVHQQQQSAANNTSSGAGSGGVSVIAHAPSTPLTVSDQRYTINGILGIQHSDPNGNSIKRKRQDEHGKYIIIKLFLTIFLNIGQRFSDSRRPVQMDIIGLLREGTIEI